MSTQGSDRRHGDRRGAFDRRQTLPPKSEQRQAVLTACLVIAIAITGYFVGISGPMLPETETTDPPAPATRAAPNLAAQGDAGDPLPALTYAELPSVLEASRRRSPGLYRLVTEPNTETPTPVSLEQKLADLADRATRRAYNGAPPTVPHPIDQLSSDSCLACHGEGLRTRSLRAGKMPHPYLAMCTQCHVEQSTTRPESMSVASQFVGLAAPESGPRAFPQAPPQMPHTMWMRTECLSCHGPAAPAGLRTTHPWRRACTQCHTPAARFEQPAAAPAKLLPPPVVEESAND